MKKFLKSSLWAGLLATAVIITSCQKENVYQPDTEQQQTIVASSSTAKLMEGTVSKDGSYDNIVDGASCFAIQFPYEVNVNGLDIKINSVDDLKLIEEIFDAVDDDDDLLDLIFPIKITMSDYSEITINGEADLRELASQCIEGGDDDDIECIDLVYPVTLFTFDTSSTQTGSVTVEGDMQMRRFFAGLGPNDIISIDFPIKFELYDGTKITVNNNAELVAVIESAKDACDEDDNNDYHDDDFTKERLDKYLVECPWLIREIERDNVVQTDQYFEYLMNFSANGEVVVKDRQGNNLTGTWSTRVSDHGVLLKLDFDVLVDFNLEWFVYEIGEGKIKLFAGDGNRIIMRNACGIFNDDPILLRNILQECGWIIKQVKVDNEEIKRLLGYEFKFMAEGVVTLTSGATVSQGTWEITTNAQGRFVMAIEMGDEPGVSFEWPVSELRNDRLKFEIPDTGYELILERVCNNNSDDGDVLEIRNIMMGGAWKIAKYSEDNLEQTTNFAAFDFAFEAENKANITVGTTGPSYLGSWTVIRNSDSQLKLYLNFGEEDPLGDLTEDWQIVSTTSNRIELKDISGGDGSIDILIFEK